MRLATADAGQQFSALMVRHHSLLGARHASVRPILAATNEAIAGLAPLPVAVLAGNDTSIMAAADARVYMAGGRECTTGRAMPARMPAEPSDGPPFPLAGYVLPA